MATPPQKKKPLALPITLAPFCTIFCRMETNVQIAKKKFHTNIHLDYDRVKFLFLI